MPDPKKARGEQMTLGSVIAPVAPARPGVTEQPPVPDALPDDMPPAVLQQALPDSVAAAQVSSAVPPPQKDSHFVHMTAEQYAKEYLGIKKDTAGSKTQPAVEKKAEPALPKTAEQGAKAPSTPVPPTSPTPSATAEPPALTEPPAVRASEMPEAVSPKEQSWRIVGEVFHSYVLVEQGERMLVIDKHAAHERILFEQLKEKLHSAEPSSQLLMLPLEVMLMSDEVALLGEYRAELEAIGFEFSAARNTISVTALPTGISPEAAGDMLCAIADRIKNDTGSAALTRDILFERALFQGACKAAIKAGRVYAEGHIEWLVGKLMELPNITACPHGRPVAMEMTKRNFDHQFERS